MLNLTGRYISGGELFDALTTRTKFGEAEAAYIMQQLLGAITYCHAHNVVHRDLKPENILIESSTASRLTVKIIDFGTALICPPDKKITGPMGSAYYIAPEVLESHYTSQCDVWSLGVILYLLLSGTPPFNGVTDEDIMAAIVTKPFAFAG